MQHDLTRQVLAALEAHGVTYVVFGGVAVNLLGLARATEDLDIFVQAQPDNIERLKQALESVFGDPNVQDISATELMGAYPAVQYIPPEGTFHVDILTRLGEAFTFEDLEAMRLEFDGVEVSVATPQTLYRMKKDTVRPRDRADAHALAAMFGLEDD